MKETGNSLNPFQDDQHFERDENEISSVIAGLSKTEISRLQRLYVKGLMGASSCLYFITQFMYVYKIPPQKYAEEIERSKKTLLSIDERVEKLQISESELTINPLYNVVDTVRKLARIQVKRFESLSAEYDTIEMLSQEDCDKKVQSMEKIVNALHSYGEAFRIISGMSDMKYDEIIRKSEI